MKYLSYCELTEEQKNQADKLYYLLGKIINDPIFWIDKQTQNILSICGLARDQKYSDTWGYFCYEHRKSFPISENCCEGDLIYPVRYKKNGKILEELKNFREQLNNVYI